MRVLVAALTVLILLGHDASSTTLDDFDWRWTYSAPLYDLKPEAVLGSRAQFESWRREFEPVLKGEIDAVPIREPVRAWPGMVKPQRGYKLQTIIFQWQPGLIEDNTPIGGTLAVPDAIDPNKPLIIALHGHEIPNRGTNPVMLFKEHSWPEKLVQAGYAVWAPSHLFYTQLSRLYQEHDYHIVWTRMESVMLDAAAPHFPPHNGVVVTGLSSGGTTGAFLMAYRPDLAKGVFAGSFVSLDWLRENYRIAGHPNNWDVRFLTSYLPVYALIAPRPVEWQLGRKDGFFPRTKPLEPVQPIFPGAPRAVDTADTVGEFLVLQRIWEKYGTSPSLYLHDGGHEFVVDEALRYIESTSY